MNDSPGHSPTTGSPRGVPNPTFKSLWLGRIMLAQIEQGRASPVWFWSLRFCEEGEKPAFSAPTEAEARTVREAHAQKVLA